MGDHRAISQLAIQNEIQRQFDRKVGDLVAQKCQYIGGKLVRGLVTKVSCRECKAPRFDDGTRCGSCGAYQQVRENPEDDILY